MAVEFTVTHNHKYALNLHSNVPIKEIVALLREIEQNMNYKEIKPCTLAIKVPPNEIIKEIKVHSLKSLEPITKLPSPIVMKILTMLVRSGVVYGQI